MSPTRSVLTGLALVAVLSSAFAAETSDVIKLTKANFDDVVAKEKLVMVKFFAPWCGHCQSMAEDFKTAATELKGKAVLADVDATEEEELAKKYNIDGFPTLKVFANGEELTDYNGGRDKNSMIKFIERATLPPFHESADAAAFDKVVGDNKEKNLLVGVGLESANLITFRKAAFALRDVMPDSIDFIHAANAKAAAGSVKDAAAGSIYLLRSETDGGHTTIKYDDKGEVSLEKFVKSAALPIFQEFTQENAEIYTELSTPVVIGFFKDCSDGDCKIIEKIAKSRAGNGKVAFAWANKETLASFMDYVGLKDSKTPICAYAFENDSRFVLPEDFVMSEKALDAWVKDLEDGKLKPAFKSQPIPEENDGPVYTIVGDSWDKEVEKSGKDVFIAQVADWCGHCQALKPILKKVGEALKNAGVDHVRIATMEATENDAPDAYKARGFPTVHYFKSGSPGQEFNGDRSSKGIIDFIKENTSKKFEFDTSTLGEDPQPEEEEGEGEADAEGAEHEGEGAEHEGEGAEHEGEGAEHDLDDGAELGDEAGDDEPLDEHPEDEHIGDEGHEDEQEPADAGEEEKQEL